MLERPLSSGTIVSSATLGLRAADVICWLASFGDFAADAHPGLCAYCSLPTRTPLEESAIAIVCQVGGRDNLRENLRC